MKKKALRALRGTLAALCLFALLCVDTTPLSLTPSASAVTQAEIDAKKAEKRTLESQKSVAVAQLHGCTLRSHTS